MKNFCLLSRLIKKNVCKKMYVHERSIKIQFFFDKSTTLLLYQVHYTILTWFSEKNHVNLYIITITSSCEYMLCTWLLKMRRLKKKTFTTTNPPNYWELLKNMKQHLASIFITWFYLFFWETVIIFYFMDGDDAMTW